MLFATQNQFSIRTSGAVYWKLVSRSSVGTSIECINWLTINCLNSTNLSFDSRVEVVKKMSFIIRHFGCREILLSARRKNREFFFFANTFFLLRIEKHDSLIKILQMNKVTTQSQSSTAPFQQMDFSSEEIRRYFITKNPNGVFLWNCFSRDCEAKRKTVSFVKILLDLFSLAAGKL